MPPPPKDPAIRQRQNVKTEAAELPAFHEATVPELENPDAREWHPLTLKWWTDVWKSPMATRYLATDVHTLGMVALLVDEFYKVSKTSQRLLLAAEIRQQTARFGLSNWDRNRMNWSIAPPEKSSDKSDSKETFDPRKTLRAV